SYVGRDFECGNVSFHAGSTFVGGDGIERGTSRTFVVPKGEVHVHWHDAAGEFDEVVELTVGETRALPWPRPKGRPRTVPFPAGARRPAGGRFFARGRMGAAP